MPHFVLVNISFESFFLSCTRKYIYVYKSPAAQSCSNTVATLQRFCSDIAANSVLYGIHTYIYLYFNTDVSRLLSLHYAQCTNYDIGAYSVALNDCTATVPIVENYRIGLKKRKKENANVNYI